MKKKKSINPGAVKKGKGQLPKKQKTELELGLEAFNEGKYIEAKEHFTKVLEETPNKYLAWNMLSKTLIMMGKHNEAIKPTQKALELAEEIAEQQEEMNMEQINMLNRRLEAIKIKTKNSKTRG